ncbi:hypothetical protein Bca52824_013507 [Brassica carinata]|uniref:RING-CH-type domain-containing protein n=1 Tax=Brassica carinata TaxID=52824 RepID=A0A8X7VYD9_BRACI|nr:hypothetical protein Bca52824_013507 [Brassica carinata]
MGDVILFIEDRDLKSNFSRCRICHEEEAESYFEAPCSCSGTLKFAHRDCIQRWCDEKGNTICEICLQEYKPGYTTTSKPSRLVEASITIRVRRQNGGRRNRRLVDRTESDFQECNSDAGRSASPCRYLVLLFSVVLLIKHAFDVVYGPNEYPFTIFTVFALKAIGILLPMLVIIRTVAAIQSSLRHQFLESEEDALNSEDEDDGLEEEEQQQHLA